MAPKKNQPAVGNPKVKAASSGAKGKGKAADAKTDAAVLSFPTLQHSVPTLRPSPTLHSLLLRNRDTLCEHSLCAQTEAKKQEYVLLSNVYKQRCIQECADGTTTTVLIKDIGLATGVMQVRCVPFCNICTLRTYFMLQHIPSANAALRHLMSF